MQEGERTDAIERHLLAQMRKVDQAVKDNSADEALIAFFLLKKKIESYRRYPPVAYSQENGDLWDLSV